MPLAREKLNKSDIGEESGCASSFKIILLHVIESGPAALPVLSARRVDSSSEGSVEMLSSFRGGSMNAFGNVAFVSVKNVCSVKCVFKISAFSRWVEQILSSCESGGIPKVSSGFTNGLSVLHRSFCLMLVSFNLVAKCLTFSDLDLRISLVT